MNLLITTAPGLESLVKRECERLKFTIRGVEDRAVRIETDIAGMIRANIWLRCANRVYIELGEGKATDFDALFDVVRAIKWKPLRPRDFPIQVDTVLVRSTLTSEPAVQRIVKKAIVESLVLKK